VGATQKVGCSVDEGQEVSRSWRPALGGREMVGIGGARLSVHADSVEVSLSGVKHLPNKEPLASHLQLHLEAIVDLSGHRPPTPSLTLAYGHLQSFLTTVLYLSQYHVRRGSPGKRVRQRTVLPRESPRGWSTTVPQRRFSVPRCALAWRSIFVVLILEPPSSPCKLCSAPGRSSSDSLFR